MAKQGEAARVEPGARFCRTVMRAYAACASQFFTRVARAPLHPGPRAKSDDDIRTIHIYNDAENHIRYLRYII